MKEIVGNLWEVYQEYDAFCITTNGVVRKDGKATMGRGIALQATDRMLGIDYKLGFMIKKYGNVVHKIRKWNGVSVCSFPTKYHFKENSSLYLIERSCKQLIALTNTKGWDKVLIPFPGVNNGKLSKDEVRKVINKLDDRFYIISNTED